MTDTTAAATATTGESFPAGDLWKDQPVIVFVVRRPGCALCREHGELRAEGFGARTLRRSHSLTVRDRFRTIQEKLLYARIQCSICWTSESLECSGKPPMFSPVQRPKRRNDADCVVHTPNNTCFVCGYLDLSPLSHCHRNDGVL